MIYKEHQIEGARVAVTFMLSGDYWLAPVSVVGDFNNWDPHAHPLRRDENGIASATVELATGHRYLFRYVDGAGNWFNDGFADDFEINGYDTYNSVLET